MMPCERTLQERSVELAKTAVSTADCIQKAVEILSKVDDFIKEAADAASGDPPKVLDLKIIVQARDAMDLLTAASASTKEAKEMLDQYAPIMAVAEEATAALTAALQDACNDKLASRCCDQFCNDEFQFIPPDDDLAKLWFQTGRGLDCLFRNGSVFGVVASIDTVAVRCSIAAVSPR